MKNFVLVLGIFILSQFNAQVWCPPGAEWYFNSDPRYYTHIVYSGTATVNGQECQKLDVSRHSYNGPIQTVTPSYYTRVNNNVVYLLNMNTNNFDTLYDFNAVPGSVWRLPTNFRFGAGLANQCGKPKAIVTATGYMNVQGVNLKWMKLAAEPYINGMDTIFERAGLIQNYFFNYDNCTRTLDVWEGGKLRCYMDSELTLKRFSRACDYLDSPIGLEEKSIEPSFELFPNPLHSTLNLSVTDKFAGANLQLYIYDVSGKAVREEEINLSQGNTTLDVSGLEKGIYFVKISDGTQILVAKKIMKE